MEANEIVLMKSRLKDMNTGDLFWFFGVIYYVKSMTKKEIIIAPVSSKSNTSKYGANCMMWVELIENESKKAA